MRRSCAPLSARTRRRPPETGAVFWPGRMITPARKELLPVRLCASRQGFLFVWELSGWRIANAETNLHARRH